MRRIQIYIDERVDDALAIEAARRNTSKAALIRDCIKERLPTVESRRAPADDIVGWIEEQLLDAGSVDDVVYGR